jgi:hypothetical protein
MKSFLRIFTIFLTVIISFMPLSAFAHNGGTIAVRVARHPIILDGEIDDIEWDDASKINQRK